MVLLTTYDTNYSICRQERMFTMNQCHIYQAGTCYTPHLNMYMMPVCMHITLFLCNILVISGMPTGI